MPTEGRTGVIIVDFQKEWSLVDSPFNIGRTSLAADKCRTLVHEALQRDLPVFYTQKFIEDHQEKAFSPYETRSDMHDELPSDPEIEVIDHYSWDPFYQTMLEDMLIRNEVEHVVVAGLAVNAGVRECVSSAYDRDFTVTLMEDGCSAESHEVMQYTLEDLQRYRDIFIDVLQNFRSFL
ncbi:MAG: isochorismatase family protein [Candidatus Nanohaloarchaea archaeon]|nr:isochorismatase family protein [Candidatus Nanohaloarchaea archaeon]